MDAIIDMKQDAVLYSSEVYLTRPDLLCVNKFLVVYVSVLSCKSI